MTRESNGYQKEPADIVWDKIMDSANRRIDYEQLVAAFGDFGDPALSENFLFQVIIGRAAGEDTETIASKLESHLMVLGIGVENGSLVDLIEEIEPAVSKEILATKAALLMFQEGNHPIDVLASINQLL